MKTKKLNHPYQMGLIKSEDADKKVKSWAEMRLIAIGLRFTMFGMSFDAAPVGSNEFIPGGEAQFDNGNWFPLAVSEELAGKLNLPILGWTDTILANSDKYHAPISEVDLRFEDFTLVRVPVIIMPGSHCLIGNPIFSLLNINPDKGSITLNEKAVKKHLRVIGEDKTGIPIYSFKVIPENEFDLDFFSKSLRHQKRSSRSKR